MHKAAKRTQKTQLRAHVAHAASGLRFVMPTFSFVLAALKARERAAAASCELDRYALKFTNGTYGHRLLDGSFSTAIFMGVMWSVWGPAGPYHMAVWGC